MDSKKVGKTSPNKKKQRAEWLTSCIDKQSPSPNLWEKIARDFSTIYIPSTNTILFILFLVFTVWLLTNSGKILSLMGLENWILFRTPYYSKESNYFQNLIAIHAGIGTIIFALIILIAESLRDNESKDTARVLLKVSYLFPLTVAEVFVFFLFLFGDVNFLSIVSVITIAVFTIISLQKTIKVLLDKPLFTSKRIELLNERIKKIIDRAIDERIGNNLFLTKLKENDPPIEYRLFLSNETNHHVIKSDKFGVVTDINLSLLAEIAETIQNEAEKNGTLLNTPQTPIFDKQTTETNRLEGQYKLELNVHKIYRETILEGNRATLSFDKSYVTDTQLLEKIHLKAQKVFKLAPVGNFDELVKSQMSTLKGQFIDAISNRKINVIEELCKIYIGVAEGYLSSMEPYGGGFSFEQARNERSAAYIGGWEQMRWLASDIRSLIVEAIQSKNQEILFEVAGLSIRISRLALQKDDHYLFQEFSWFPGLFYHYSQKEDIQQEIKTFLFDRSWRHFRDLSEYHIKRRLEENLPEDEKESVKNFAITVLLTFQDLLKAAYDNQDIGGFRKFQQTTLSLFRNIDHDSMHYEIDFFKSQLENPNLPFERKNQLETQLERHLIFQEIYNHRLQMFFGLVSWIFDEYKKNPEYKQIQGFYNCVQSVFDISLEKLTKVFLDVHSYDTEDFWNWGRWDTILDGQVHSIQILEKLEQFYVVKALSILADQSGEKVDQVTLPYNRYFAYLAGGSRDLIKTLDNIKNSPENWQFVLSEPAIAKVEKLRSLLLKAKEKQERDDIERKRATAISNEKVKTFTEDFLIGFYKNANLRKLIENVSTIKMNLSEKPAKEIRRFGFNTIDDKAAFFDDWHVYFDDWGESYGRNLALGENAAILKQIIESCVRLDDIDFKSILSKFTNINNVLILLVNNSSFNLFRDDEGFRYHKSSIDNSRYGFYEFHGFEIPVYEFFHKNTDTQTIILNKNKIDELVQYSPLGENDTKNLMKDIFLMDMRSFNENKDLLKDMLDDPPDWLQENRNREAQRLYLQERVLIKIQECFEIVLSDDYQGYYITSDN